jgi:DNA-binding NarL/FixJ family response regulator
MGRNHLSNPDDSKRSKGFAAGDAKMGPGAQACARNLTAAEIKVLNLLSLAKTNKEIATSLGISPATVKRHLENVLRKLRLKNRIEAAIYGLMINRCPHQSDSGCALESWRRERNSAAAIWAD